MTSDAQIAANRRNAHKSTGPRTQAGLDVARKNALRHGMAARQVVVAFDETVKDFTRFYEEMRAAFAPADAVEEQLVERIILCHWRLRRTSRAEVGVFNVRSRDYLLNDRLRHAGIGFDRPEKLLALSRYETALQRSLDRAQASLERRQARRAGERVLAPISVQIEGMGEAVAGDPLLDLAAADPRQH